jgi:hypothetical protein
MTIVRAALAAAFVLAVSAACSEQPRVAQGGITIVDPWARATPAGAMVGAGYMQIVNAGASAVKLVGGQTPVAERVEFHMMSMEGGVMTMRSLPEGLEVPAQSTVTLAPGGTHAMLIGLKRALVQGESVPLTLIFDNGVRIDVRLAVRAIGAGHGH